MNKNNHDPLAEMISNKTIALNAEVKDWKEAVRVSGNLLLNAGLIKESYIDAMIETVQSMGPYIVIAPGVAMPHARPEDGVIEPCMSLVTLKTPVNFGNENNDPVRLVISFGTVDQSAHVDALKKIARIIGDNKKVKNLLDANKVEQVEKIISAPID